MTKQSKKNRKKLLTVLRPQGTGYCVARRDKFTSINIKWFREPWISRCLAGHRDPWAGRQTHATLDRIQGVQVWHRLQAWFFKRCKKLQLGIENQAKLLINVSIVKWITPSMKYDQLPEKIEHEHAVCQMWKPTSDIPLYKCPILLKGRCGPGKIYEDPFVTKFSRNASCFIDSHEILICR